MLIESLYTLLTTDAGITALLKPNGGPRKDGRTGVFPCVAPTQATLPYVEFEQTGASQVTSMDGPNRLQFCRININCYASSALAATQLSSAIKLAIGGLQGVVGEAQVQDIVLLREASRETSGWVQGTGSMAAYHGTMFNVVVAFEITFVDLVAQ
jgi:Protein of unknown function (DUF3168)